jgi:hypothetical protein
LVRIAGTSRDYLCTFITPHRILLKIRNVSEESCTEYQNTHFMFSNIFPKIAPFIRLCRKIRYGQRGQRRQNGACALNGGYIRLQTQTQNMQYLLLFLGNNSFTNAPQCYVLRTLLVFFPISLTAVPTILAFEDLLPCSGNNVNSSPGNVHPAFGH